LRKKQQQPDMRKLIETRIVLASHNQGKLREITQLLKPFGISVVPAGELGFDEPEETEDNFAGNARIKAHYAAQKSGLAALSDDSGIEVDALDLEPGVYTADWAETPSGRDFPMAMAKVWGKLEDINAPEPRTARFRSTLCLAWPDGDDELFEGKAEGRLVWPMRGNKGFGFDPMFIPNGQDLTFAEMAPSQKRILSHRTDAFNKLIACLGG